MDKVEGQCLICERQLNNKSPNKVRPAEEPQTSQLEVLFLLRKVVEVPDLLLLKFLEDGAATRPDLCDPCQVTVKECREVHEQLCDLQTKWNHCKTRIVNKVKERTEMSPPPQEDEGYSSVLDLRKETTRFVMTQVNSFPPRTDSATQTEETDDPTTSSLNAISSREEGGNTPSPIKNEVVMELRPATNPQGRSHPCPQCPQKYVSPYLLQSHLLAHPEMDGIRKTKKQHKCGDCGKQFSQKGNLQTHELIHKGEKSHECQLCHKRFRQKVNLNRHMEAHLGEKHFKCEICGKAFVTKQQLMRHTTRHTREKRWKCNLCPKVYAYQNRLSSHTKIHHTN